MFLFLVALLVLVNGIWTKNYQQCIVAWAGFTILLFIDREMMKVEMHEMKLEKEKFQAYTEQLTKKIKKSCL
jgi:putative Mn2+ efflux pump MntP